MLFIILLALSCTLFGGFLILTAVEQKRQARVFSGSRAVLDKQISRVSFIISHVDWSAFVKHLVRTNTEKFLHDVAHGSLIVVRFVERTLTGVVRAMRERRSGLPSLPTNSGQHTSLRETLRGFRKVLQKGKKGDT